MATNLELFSAISDSDLSDKITVAVLKAAEVIRTESAATDNHVNRLLWAKQALGAPVQMAQKMIGAVIAANASASLSAILSASDSAIDNNVLTAVDVFADGS